VPHRKPLALHQILARGRHIEQQIDEVILQQIDLVDIEKAPVRLGQQPRLEPLFTRAQRALQIERADHAVFGRAQWQIHERHRALDSFLRSARIRAGARVRRRAAEPAAFHRGDRRQKRCKRPRCGRFARAAIAENHHPAKGRFDSGEQEGLFHLVLRDDGGEGEAVHSVKQSGLSRL